MIKSRVYCFSETQCIFDFAVRYQSFAALASLSHRWSRSRRQSAASNRDGPGCRAVSSCCASGWYCGRWRRSTGTMSRRRAATTSTGDGRPSAVAGAALAATSPMSTSLYPDSAAAADDVDNDDGSPTSSDRLSFTVRSVTVNTERCHESTSQNSAADAAILYGRSMSTMQKRGLVLRFSNTDQQSTSRPSPLTHYSFQWISAFTATVRLRRTNGRAIQS